MGPYHSRLVRLKDRLKAMCRHNGTWAIYVKDLNTGADICINNAKMVSASLIKLFIMAGIYKTIEAGRFENDAGTADMIRQMITVSHNESSNRLVEILGRGSHADGMAAVNRYAASIGCSDTEQQRDMRDFRKTPVAGENYTSVRDCAGLLERIYNRQCVGPESDRRMMDLLLAQRLKGKLPLLLPEGTAIAHKTGELSDTENDAGIVFGPKGDYVICVMSNGVTDTAEARGRIARISKTVYDFLGE